MRNRRMEEMLRQTRSSTNPRPSRLSANERLKNSIVHSFFKHRWETRHPDTTQEELLIERLQHTTVSDPIERSIEQTLRRFTQETNTWVLLYYSEQYYQFILPMTEEPPSHIYFVKKENPFHRTRQYWANPEFQLICSPSERIPKLYQPYLSVCPRRFTGMVSASLRERMDQEKKAKPKKKIPVSLTFRLRHIPAKTLHCFHKTSTHSCQNLALFQQNFDTFLPKPCIVSTKLRHIHAETLHCFDKTSTH